MRGPPAPLRVLHVVPALFGPEGIVGGGERYALELARHVAERTPTRLVSFGERAHRERRGALDIRVHGRSLFVRGQRTNPFHPALLRDLAWADAVHCHQHRVVASSASALLGRLLRKPVFVSDLGGGGWDISGYVDTSSWFRGHLHLSEYSRTICGHAGRPDAHVISGGVDPGRFSPDPARPREGYVLFVGRLLPHKGVNDLVDAVPPELRLEVVGPAPDARFLEELRRRAEGKQVHFHHAFDDEALVRAYRGALCVVLPSVYRDLYGGETRVPELLGQTLLEGMACGLPAVCTSVASMPEIVLDGVTGWVVPPNDPRALREKLLWLRDHPEQARAMGEAARRRVLERFTWSAVADRCLRLYRGLPAPPPGAA